MVRPLKADIKLKQNIWIHNIWTFKNVAVLHRDRCWFYPHHKMILEVYLFVFSSLWQNNWEKQIKR